MRSRLNDHLLTADTRLQDMEVKYGGSRPFLSTSSRDDSGGGGDGTGKGGLGGYGHTIPLNNLCPFHQHLKPTGALPPSTGSASHRYYDTATAAGLGLQLDLDAHAAAFQEPPEFLTNGGGTYDFSPKYGRLLSNSAAVASASDLRYDNQPPTSTPPRPEVAGVGTDCRDGGGVILHAAYQRDGVGGGTATMPPESSFLTFKPIALMTSGGGGGGGCGGSVCNTPPSTARCDRETTATDRSCASLDLIKHSQPHRHHLQQPQQQQQPSNCERDCTPLQRRRDKDGDECCCGDEENDDVVVDGREEDEEENEEEEEEEQRLDEHPVTALRCSSGTQQPSSEVSTTATTRRNCTSTSQESRNFAPICVVDELI